MIKPTQTGNVYYGPTETTWENWAYVVVAIAPGPRMNEARVLLHYRTYYFFKGAAWIRRELERPEACRYRR